MIAIKLDNPHRRTWLGYASLGFGVLCIAWSSPLVRMAGDVSGPASAFYRLLVAAMVLVPWRLARGGVWLSRKALWPALIAGVAFALDLALYNSSVLRTSAATATVLGNNAPILVGIGAWIIFRRRLPFAYWGGLVFALAGSVVLVVLDSGSTTGRHASIGGDMMALSSGAAFSIYLLATEYARMGTSKADNVDTLTLNAVAVATSVVVLFFGCIAIGSPLTGYRPHAWFDLITLGLVSQLGGYLAITYALGTLPASTTSVGLLAQIPLTAVLAALFIGESLGIAQAGAGMLVLIGVGIVARFGMPSNLPTEADTYSSPKAA